MKRILPIIAVTALAIACGRNQTVETTVQEDVVPIVEAGVAVREDVPQEAVYSTTVQANVINNIAPQSAGRIQKLNVEVGDYVTKGQILAEMDRVQLEQATLRLRNEETELARVRELFAKGGISQSDFEALELSCKVSRTTYENLLENTILRSPIDGVVTARNYDRGDLYAMAQPIYVVHQITPVKLLVGVSESDYTRVKKGDPVEITADAVPGKSFYGKIVRLYPTMDAASHTFNVEVSVPNNYRTLRPGMYAKATVKFGVNHSVVIPDVAVVKMQGSGQRSVYVIENDGTVSMVPVKLGRHVDGKYEVLEGLESGTRIVVRGQTALKSGIKVEVK